MRVGVIPNPRKEITVKGTEEEVGKWLYKIPLYMDSHIKGGYREEKLDEQIGRIIIGKSEFLSLGVRIVIDVNYKTEESTEICIEIQRVMGSFDNSAEIQYANEHLNNTIEAVKYISKNKEYNPERKNIETAEENVNYAGWIVLIVIVGSLIYFF